MFLFNHCPNLIWPYSSQIWQRLMRFLTLTVWLDVQIQIASTFHRLGYTLCSQIWNGVRQWLEKCLNRFPVACGWIFRSWTVTFHSSREGFSSQKIPCSEMVAESCFWSWLETLGKVNTQDLWPIGKPQTVVSSCHFSIGQELVWSPSTGWLIAPSI